MLKGALFVFCDQYVHPAGCLLLTIIPADRHALLTYPAVCCDIWLAQSC